MAASASTSQRAVPARWSVSSAREGGEIGVGAAALEHRQHEPGRAALGGGDHLGRDGEQLGGEVACRAVSAHARSSTGTGSSSPAMATSMAAFSSAAFVPKPSSTVGTATPAASAIARMVAPA